MSMAITVTFHGLDRSTALRDEASRHARKLERMLPEPSSCFVVIQRAGRRQHKGGRYVVRMRVVAPGHEFISSRCDGYDPSHEDAYIAVRDAFKAVRRRLGQDFAPGRARAEVSAARLN